MNESGVLTKARFLAALTTFVLVWALFAGLTANVSADRGGGDVYGYSWTDSNAPSPSVAFDWIDITGVGVDSMVTGDDQYSLAIPIGFSFPFYGTSYTDVYFSTNGLITFAGGSSAYSNRDIPNTNTPNLLIAPYWDDLCVDYGTYNDGAIYYQSLGSSPNRQFVVEWWQVSRLGTSTEMTFEAILNETGEIWVQYLDMNGMTGSGATIGIENSDGTVGSKYSYDQAVVSDSLAIMFTPSTVGISPSSQMDGGLPGDSVFYQVTIVNNRAVTDSFDIVCQSDAGWNVEMFDSVYNPLTDTNSNGIDDTGDVLGGGSVSIWIRVDVPGDPVVRYDNTTVMATSYVDPSDSTAVKVITKVLIAHFAPPHSDYGNDTDSDGQYNLLEIHVVVNATFPGYVHLDAYLYDAMWFYIGYMSWSGEISEGETTLRLSYTGWKLNLYGDDGPYNLDLYLYDSEWWFLNYDWYTTNAYTSDEFEEPPAHLEPPYSDEGVDGDGNGYYDALVVTIPVNVTEEGWFYLDVTLWDEMFAWIIVEEDVTTYLEVGVHDVEVWFDGRDIRDFGYSGSFGVEISLFLDVGVLEYLDDDIYWSNLYFSTEFEPPGAYLSLTHHTYGLDTNGNGYYDYLVLELSAHVTRAGYYFLWCGLYDGSFTTEIDMDMNASYLDVGVQTIELRFSGRSIHDFGYDGAFYVDAILEEEDMDLIQEVIYYTESYVYMDFEPPGAAFESPHSDTVVDTNGNGYYDYLIINASVNVSTPGYYEMYLVLYDWLSWYIDDYWNETYLEEGLQQMQIWVPGLDLYGGAWDGPYEAYMELWDDEGYFLSADIHWTAAHLWDEFEPPGATFSPPHNDSGVDTDDDGQYDYLSVNVSIDVMTAGDYLIDADLWPLGIWETVEVYLDEGIQSVEILFDGRQINASGYDGTFDLDLWIYDLDWNNLDYGFHTTGVYSSDDFESIPVSFSAPHGDYGLNASGGDDFEYLVVNVSVEVTEPGVYTIEAWAMSWITVFAQAEAHLDAGPQVMPVMFPAWPLYASGYSGTYWVDMNIMDDEGIFWSADSHETSSYAFTDFNGSTPTITSMWTDEAPTIDGVADPGEWDGTNAVDLVEADPVNELDSKLIVMNNATHLFVLYDVTGDTSEDEDDASSFSFDTGNDETFTNGEDDQFEMRCAPDMTAHYIYDGGWWSVDCSPFDQELPDHDGLAGAYGFGPSEHEAADHRVFEYSIPLALIEASPGDVLGFCGASWSTPGVVESFMWDYSTWPNYYGGFPAPSQHGDLVLAPERPLTTATMEGTMGLGGWYVSDVTVTLHASGGDGGVNYTMYRVAGGAWQTYAGPFDVSTQGLVMVEFYSVDMMGNEEETKSVAFMADSVAPVTTPSAVEGYEVSLLAEDATSGVGVTYYRVDDGNWTIYIGNFSVDDADTHVVEFYSIDDAGNEEAVGSVVLNETLAPNTLMSLVGGKGLGDYYVTSVVVLLTASDNAGGAGLETTMYRLDGGSWLTYPAGGVDVDGDGEHTVEFYSVDNVGNEEAVDSETFVIDCTAPSTTADVEGSNVTLEASDAVSGVDSTMYRVDGGDWTEYDGTFAVTAAGNHTVDFYSVDEAGNVEMIDSVAVQNAPSSEPGDGEEEDEGGGVSALVSGVLGLIIGAVIVAAIMMFLMRKKQPGAAASAPEEPAPEEDIPPPPT